MGLRWIAEPDPCWDRAKADAFGDLGPALFGLGTPRDGQPLGDAWWRVESDEADDSGGAVLGFGRLDDTWGDAEVLVVVADGHRGAGVGAFVLDHLEAEAAGRSLNYVYNVVPERHPHGDAVRAWLRSRGFGDTEVGELRKKVTTGAAGTGPSQ